MMGKKKTYSIRFTQNRMNAHLDFFTDIMQSLGRRLIQEPSSLQKTSHKLPLTFLDLILLSTYIKSERGDRRK